MKSEYNNNNNNNSYSEKRWTFIFFWSIEAIFSSRYHFSRAGSCLLCEGLSCPQCAQLSAKLASHNGSWLKSVRSNDLVSIAFAWSCCGPLVSKATTRSEDRGFEFSFHQSFSDNLLLCHSLYCVRALWKRIGNGVKQISLAILLS